MTASRLASGGALPGDAHEVLVGTWAQLLGVPGIADAAAHPASSGLFARFEGGRLVTLDALGQARTRSAAAGAVLATARAEQPDAAVWLVTGAEPADVADAAALLGGGAPRLAGCFGVAILRDHSTLCLPTGPTR